MQMILVAGFFRKILLTPFLGLLFTATVLAQTSNISPPGSPKIAFTFDDLPAHGPLPPGITRKAIAAKILAAFRDEHMPPVYGFVNGAAIEKNPGDATVLTMWHDAANPLG